MDRVHRVGMGVGATSGIGPSLRARLRPRCLAGSTRPAVRVSGADRPRSATGVTATANAAADARGDSQASRDRAPALGARHQRSPPVAIPSARVLRFPEAAALPEGLFCSPPAGYEGSAREPTTELPLGRSALRAAVVSAAAYTGPPPPGRAPRRPTTPTRAGMTSRASANCARVQRPDDSPGGWRRVAPADPAGRLSEPAERVELIWRPRDAPERDSWTALPELPGSDDSRYLQEFRASTPSRIRTGDLLRERQAS